MKKVIASLLAVVVLMASLAACKTIGSAIDAIKDRPSQSDQAKIEAAQLVREGILYEERFQEFLDGRVRRKGETVISRTTLSGSDSIFADLSYALSYKPPEEPKISGEPSEYDIDMAIELYEKALQKQPSGTWTFDNDGNWVAWWMRAPGKNVSELLADAKRTKQDWIDNSTQYAAEQARQRQADIDRQQAERVRGYIELHSDVTGALLLNGQRTKYYVIEGRIFTLAVENANGAYEVAVQDSAGTVTKAAPNQVSLSGGVRAQASVTNSRPNDPMDFDIMQNREGGITITKYKGSRATVVIPSTISGIRVTEIGIEAFRYNKNLRSVVIPNTVTSIIGNERAFSGGAFSSCGQLISVTLSDSLVSIGEYAFEDCEALTSITIPNSVTVIREGAFKKSGLTSVTLGNRLATIEASAFNGCQLTSVQIPASVKSVGGWAFQNNKITNLVIQEGVVYLEGSSFRNNPLATVVIPASLAKFSDENGFQGAFGSLTEPEKNLTRITMPANVDDRNFNQTLFHLPNFEESFVNFYKLQGKKAGTYVKVNRIWTLQ